MRARDWVNELRDDVDAAEHQAAIEHCATAIDYFEQSNRAYERYNVAPGETTHHKPCAGEAVTVRREMADIYLLRAKLGSADAWLPQAIGHYRAARETYRQLYLDAPERSANALASLSVSLADALILSGELAEAQTALSTAFDYTRGQAYAPTAAPRRIRHRRNDCYALMRQAELYRRVGEHENCAKAYADAAAQLAEEGVAVDQARALALRATCSRRPATRRTLVTTWSRRCASCRRTGKGRGGSLRRGSTGCPVRDRRWAR